MIDFVQYSIEIFVDPPPFVSDSVAVGGYGDY